MQWHNTALTVAFVLLLGALRGSLTLKLRMNPEVAATLRSPEATFEKFFEVLLRNHNYSTILKLLAWRSFETRPYYQSSCSFFSDTHLKEILHNYRGADTLELLLPPECLVSISAAAWDQTVPGAQAHFAKIIASPHFQASNYEQEAVEHVLLESLQNGNTSADYCSFFSSSSFPYSSILSSLKTRHADALFWHVTPSLFTSFRADMVGDILDLITGINLGPFPGPNHQLWGSATWRVFNAVLCRTVSLLAFKSKARSFANDRNELTGNFKSALSKFVHIYNTVSRWSSPSPTRLSRYCFIFDSLLRKFVRAPELRSMRCNLRASAPRQTFNSLFDCLVSRFDSTEGNGSWMINLFSLFIDHLQTFSASSLTNAFRRFFAHSPTDHAILQLSNLIPPTILCRFNHVLPVPRIPRLIPLFGFFPERTRLLPLALRQSMVIKYLRSPKVPFSDPKSIHLSPDGPVPLDRTGTSLLLIEICETLNNVIFDPVLFKYNFSCFGNKLLFSELVQEILQLFAREESILCYTVGISAIDNRPIIVPSPAFPLRFTLVLGALLAHAIALNVHIPFLLDRSYFEAALSEPPRAHNDNSYLKPLTRHIAKSGALRYLARADYLKNAIGQRLELEDLRSVIRTGKRGKSRVDTTFALDAAVRNRDASSQRLFAKGFRYICKNCWLLSPTELYAFTFYTSAGSIKPSPPI